MEAEMLGCSLIVLGKWSQKQGILMGMDFECVCEKKVEGKYVRVDLQPTPFNERFYHHYYFFIEEGAPIFFAQRGLPYDDMCPEVYDYYRGGFCKHSESWVLLSELFSINYEQCYPAFTDGTLMTLREYLGESFFIELERMRESGVDRMVYWLDQ